MTSFCGVCPNDHLSNGIIHMKNVRTEKSQTFCHEKNNKNIYIEENEALIKI